MHQPVVGFSKFSKEDKIDWVAQNYTKDPKNAKILLERYWNSDSKVQKVHDEFIENTLSNYYLPFAVAPNFLIDGNLHVLPMVIEESSVVAAAGKAAKFWLDRGGFKTTIVGTEKVGQVHFFYTGQKEKLQSFFLDIKNELIENVSDITQSMRKRGGGISSIELRDKTGELANYYQLHCTFETLDAMGANFINSCLEEFAKTLERQAAAQGIEIEVTMSILSNYVPNCLVRAEASCSMEQLNIDGVSGQEFSKKFINAIAIAKSDPHRAVTHNKGVMNGVDALVLATGNDFRAVEAGVHAYASKDGSYSSLTHAEIRGDQFRFWIELPLALGTVGGLTSLHPMVKLALEILQKPSAEQLMRIVAVAGLAQNFAALRSLVTTGIQKGHMKMHLMNLLNQMGASELEKKELITYFKDKTVNNAAVKEALQNIKKG
ncbi:MAG: hydroxymethylglutaryl-CoA reductase, degradative [Allomuricauda sp.]|nr:MAG: hydroxymethylglutaryl-CoA reductase, degradative [Allomuricauda sp.]